MVPDLLKYDKKYLPREANADDKNCEWRKACCLYTLFLLTWTALHCLDIAYIIFIVNACYMDLSIVSLLPKYCFSHFLYLRSRFPDCFPNLKVKNFSMFAMIKIFPVAHSYDFQEIFSKAPPDIIKQSQDIWGGESEGTASPSSNDDSLPPPILTTPYILVKDWTTAEDVNQYMDGTLDMIASMTKQLGGSNANGVQQSANIISR